LEAAVYHLLLGIVEELGELCVVPADAAVLVDDG